MRNESKTCEKLKSWFLKKSSLESWKEVQRVLLVGSVMFCILFMYTVTRDLKDSLILRAPGCDVSTISLLKVVGVIPAVAISIAIFFFLNKKFGSKKTFNILVIFFTVFYFVLGILIFYRCFFHFLPEDIEQYQQTHNSLLGSLYAILGNWLFALFYIFSEVLGALILSSIFWQFATKTCRSSNLKKYFMIYSYIGSLGLIFSSMFIKLLLAYKMELLHQIMSIVFAGILVLFLLKIANKKFLVEEKNEKPSAIFKKQNLKESLQQIISSKYLRFIFSIVICYGIGMHICEACWNEQLRLANIPCHEINEIKTNCSFFTGILTILITILGSLFSKKLSLKIFIFATPVLVLFFGGIFFLFLNLGTYSGLNHTISSILIIIGSVLEVFVRSSKFALFDTSKQMLYEPLDENLKTNGQAAVEALGGKSGKMLGSMLIIGLRTFFGIFLNCSLLLTAILALVGFFWIFSTYRINKMYKEKMQKLDKTEIHKKKIKRNKLKKFNI